MRIVVVTLLDEVSQQTYFTAVQNSFNHKHTHFQNCLKKRHRIQQEGFIKKVLTLKLRVLLAFEC